MPLLIHLNSKIALKKRFSRCTPQNICIICWKMQKEVFYEITDYLNTNLILFCFDNTCYLLGPYVKNTFSSLEMQELLASHKLPASILLPLKLYYDQFPQLSYSMIHGTVLAAMRTFIPNTPEFSYRKLTGFHEELKTDKLILESNNTYYQS